MSVAILEKGLMDTLQDLGRFGYAAQGINPEGVMDDFAASAANFLVGNEAKTPVMEVHFPAPMLQFNETQLVSFTGAEFRIMVNGHSIPTWQPVIIKAGSTVKFPGYENGMRLYIAVKSGWKAEYWLDSASTQLQVKKGGWQGSTLEKGGTLYFNTSHEIELNPFLSTDDFRVLPWKVDFSSVYTKDHIQVIPDRVGDDNLTWLLPFFDKSTFIILPNSNRMGLRLQGPKLPAYQGPEPFSAPVTNGTLQWLPSGEIIILMAGRQATGGYPRLATVISTDICRLAQLEPGKPFKFSVIQTDTAAKFLKERNKTLSTLSLNCFHQLNHFFHGN